MGENTRQYHIYNQKESYYAFGDTMLDAINIFDKSMRGRTPACYVSNVVLDEGRCGITVVGLDKDTIGFSCYRIEECIKEEDTEEGE